MCEGAGYEYCFQSFRILSIKMAVILLQLCMFTLVMMNCALPSNNFANFCKFRSFAYLKVYGKQGSHLCRVCPFVTGRNFALIAT